MLLTAAMRKFLPPVVHSLERRLRGSPFCGVVDSPDLGNHSSLWADPERIRGFENAVALMRENPIPPSDISSYNQLLLFFNMLSSTQLTVLDFAGGVGNSYFQLERFFYNKNGIEWHVVDCQPLIEAGRNLKLADDKVHFYERIPDLNFDVVFVSSSMQYLYEPETLFEAFLNRKPRYLVFTRVPLSETKPFYMLQKEGRKGKKVTYKVHSFQFISQFFDQRGYSLIYCNEAPEDHYGRSWYKNVPVHLQVRRTKNLIFHCREI
ncbi:MAG: methyltransferase, TIGR04325 family [Deltaproteobacteria bacterium]|nr:methyltransferase, TIGR04325 family [Deltaproteobacteria bacterium]